jgi:predicted ATP-grasp superfamily ATP-dependent carboligase
MGVLLLGANYYGTLAAARCFGRSGIDVAMADEDPRARSLFSRYVVRRLTHPPIAKPTHLVRWLEAYGRAHPGTLLYPTNDHLAWLFAANAGSLRSFATYAPDEHAILTMLDKKRLHAACVRVGIDVPETHDPSVRAPLRFPLLLKPRTQAFLEGGIKGVLVERRDLLDGALARFRQIVRFAPVLAGSHPELAEPLAQEYVPSAETSIVSVAGFVTREADLVSRAALKVLQRPRKVGIGLCFEGREIDETLARRIRALCAHVGYFGAFECELIADGPRRLLIDFNPRFYSQMGFEIARGLPIPLLVWHAARGEDDRVADLLARARAWRAGGAERYCHKAMLDLVLFVQGLSGEMSRVDVRRWRTWHVRHAETVTDAVSDPDDRLPSFVDAAQWLGHFARHPRSFVRSYVLNR